MRRFYVVTMWSGGKAGKRWKSLEEPQILPQGTGVEFRDLDTKLPVYLIGSISVEEYEEGLDEWRKNSDLPPGLGTQKTE